MARLMDLKAGDKLKVVGGVPYYTSCFIDGKEYELKRSRNWLSTRELYITDEDGDEWYSWELSDKEFEKVESKEVEQPIKTNVYRFLYENGEYGTMLIENNTYLEALDYLDELTLDLGRFHKLTHLATLSEDELELYSSNSKTNLVVH